MPAFFISDIHLHPTRPQTVEQLLRVFKRMVKNTEQSPCKQLFLLGDIFDAWIGDDDPEPLWQQIKQSLLQLREQGFDLYWIAGNRDFLVGQRFMQETSCQALVEPTAFILEDGHRVVLLHGDLLCTQDVGYQRFRRVVRHPWVVRLYQSLALGLRLGIARQLRRLSRFSQKQKTIPLSLNELHKKKGEEGKKQAACHRGGANEWINEAMSDALLNEHNATTLIHGHIHRAGVYNRALLSDGKSRQVQRIVLGDWDAGASVLVFKEGHFRFWNDVEGEW